MFNRLLVFVLVGLLLGGCLKPMTATTPQTHGVVSASTTHLHGQIGTMKGYHVQLTDLLEDFAKGATVSLIEVSTGNTVGTSIADASGSFVIQFGARFTAKRANESDTRSIGYYLEAVKGLKGGNSTPNQAGADALRLRTLIWYDFANSGWISLGNQTPGPISVSIGTTAVAFYINQQLVNAQAVTPEAYIGSLNPLVDPPAYLGTGTGVIAGTGVRNLTADAYTDLFTQITNAVAKDQDPLHSIVLSPTGGAVNTQTSFTFAGMSPLAGGIGATVTIAGTGFEPGNMTVNFVGAAATINVGSSNATTLVVDVPAGARSGLIQLTLNGVNTYTTPFQVTSHDGHRVFFSDAGGNATLYAVSSTLGTLVRVNPDGSTYTLSTALSSPRGVLVNPEGATSAPYKIYVANGNNKVVQMDSTGAVINADWLGVTDPYALALGPDDDLYVAQRSSNQITRYDVNWAAGTLTGTVATYTGFSAPSALAFDPSGNLYAVETAAGQVRRFKPALTDSGSLAPTLEDWAFITDPKGIAVDSAGNSFVTSQTNNIVYRIDAFRNMSTFTNVDAACAIARDDLGNLYVGDQGRNLIMRITLAGDQRILSYGLSGLRGVAVDGSSNLYVALQNSGAVLKIGSDGKTTSPLITGISAPWGLTYRNGKIFVAHSDTHNVSEVALNGSARSVITSGLRYPGSVEVSDDGTTLYVGRQSFGYDSTWTGPDGVQIKGQSCGLNVVTNGVNTFRPAWNEGDYEVNELTYSTWQIDANTYALLNNRRKKLTLMSSIVSGQTAGQAIADITPPFGGTKLFPTTVRDLVYDGSRYFYVACDNRNLYRIDTQNPNAEPGIITGLPGTPHGLAYLAGTLYVADNSSNKLRRVSAPATATTVDSEATWVVSGLSGPKGLTPYGGRLYIADYSGKRILKVDPATPGTVETHVDGLNGSPSRIRAYNDGRLLVRCSDSIVYQISATGSVTEYDSWVGCGGCDRLEFIIDQSNNSVIWSQGRNGYGVHTRSMINTHELARDGNWLYVATMYGLYGINVATQQDLSVTGTGSSRGLAVLPGGDLAVLNSGGSYYTVNGTTRAVTSRGSLGTDGWGLDYDADQSKLYAAGSGNNLIYEISPSTWARTSLKVGLVAPLF